MDKQVKSILKRTAAAALSAAMVLTMGLGAVPSAVYAGDLSGAEARNESREVKIDLSEIASMSAKTYGPQGDGDTLEASFDGDTTTYTNSNYNDPANGKPQVYTFNFADTVDLCKVRIHPRNSGGAVGNGAPNSCTVEVSTDGVQYTQVAQSAVTDTSLTWTDIAFAAVPASSVRLTLDSAHENVVTTGEVELYKLVSEPSGADKTELDTAISTIAAKMEGLDKADYVTATWEALETALSAAQAVSADPNATEEQVAGALADLQAADTGLSVLVSPVYMTDFVSYENGRVTVELNGPTDYIPDGSTKWTYEYKDGRHLLYTDDWDNDALTSGETENYREVCIYDLNKKNPEWSYIYIDEDGNGTIAGTSYNAEKPKGTLIAGGKEYDISNSGDLEEIEGLKFTATPVVILKGINLSDVSRQRTGVGEAAVDVEVTDPTRTSVEIPLVNQKGSAASGKYSISTHWADGKVLYYNVKINSVSIIDRSGLEEAIEAAEALTETDYTPDSWAAMQEKLAAAKDVLGDCIATKTEVADAAEQLNTAVADLAAAAPKVDKSELQALYDEVKDAAFTYPDNSYYEKFTTALTNAADILENQEADQETVDSAHDNLERFYWLNMVNDKVAYYNFNKQGEDGRFVYDDRPTESILPVVAAFLEGHNSSASWTTERLVNCYNRFVEAEKLIQEPTPDALGVQVGLNVDAADADNPGYFEITGEEAVEENGKTMIKVSFDFVNDGIDSVTGKDIGAYSLSTMTKANFRVRYTRPEGGSVTKFVSDDSLDSLDGSWSKGVTGEVTVEPGSTVNLEMYYNSDDTFMPGYYKVISPAPEADKSKLQELYEEASAAEFKYPDATLTKYFNDALTDAKAVLDAADATQEEVDSAYYYLEKHYWQNVIEDKVAYYNPTKNGEDGRFDYSDKVTQSILPLLSAYQQTHNVNNNTEMDKLSSYYEIWEEAEKCTPETADEDMRGVEVGINTSADGFDTKDALSSGNTGHFEITGQEFTADSTGKVSVKVTFQFINDGLNPVTGAEADEYSLSEMNKASCRVTYESPSGKGSKGVTVTDRSKSSLTGEFTVDQDSVISLSLEDSTMLGFFKVQKFTSADKTELEKVIAEAAETIAQEYNYIKNDNWDALIASYEKAEEIYNDPFAGQDEVNAASLELVGRLAFVTYETTPPEAVFVVNGSEQEITENVLIGENFDLKFTDNGRLYQFLLNGREFEITGTEDTAAFSEIESALNEGNGEDGKNILTVRDSVPPLFDIYLTEVTYTFYFDQTAPETEVSYSTTELTNGDVTVKVTSNEALDEGAVPEGWTLSDDGMTLTKTYESNAEENITVKDLAGNESEVSVAIANIDKTPLTLGTPEYIENEDGSVTVQIKVDSDIDLTKLPEGWTYADGSVTKTFEKSAEESVTLYDEAGNVSSATVKVTISDKTDEQKPGDDGKKPGSDEGKPSDSQKPAGDKDTAKTAVKTGDESSPVIWAVVLIAACAAAAAVIVVRKKRK